MTIVGVAVAALMVCPYSAQSAVPVYAGHLGIGGTAVGSAMPDSGPFGTPELWEFWTLSVPFASEPVPFSTPITVTVRRLNPNLDPVVGVWFGQEADTAS